MSKNYLGIINSFILTLDIITDFTQPCKYGALYGNLLRQYWKENE